MKKQFLKFALLTTMVAGGATLSVNADDMFAEGGTSPVGTCEFVPTALCTVILGSPLYLNPGPSGEQGDPITEEDWNFTGF